MIEAAREEAPATPTFTASAPAPDDFVDRHFLRRGAGVEFEMEADWIRSHLPTTARWITDVGCGNGSLFQVAGTDRVLGIDRCAGGLAITRARFPSVPVLCADALQLPFTEGCLDAITAQHVIEHIADCERACHDWFRVLRPGGKLLVLTPNASFCDPTAYDDETHTHIFDAGHLHEMLIRVGFEIADLRSIGLPWFRRYHQIAPGWRLRRLVTSRAAWLSSVPSWRWRGQTLCCAARRPTY